MKQHEHETRLFEIYARAPIRFNGDIPVFSEVDEYIDNYERIARDHLAFLNGDSRFSFPPEYFARQTEASTVSLLRKYAKPGMKILDVGVSRGYLLSYFDDLDRYGLDISFGYLEIARSRGIEVCYARVEDMPYRSEVFDIVVCTDVLEHVLDLNLCCQKILSVLKQTGVLIIRVPYLEDLGPYLSDGFPYKYVHFRTFDIPTLRLLFEKIFDCTVSEVLLAGYYADERRRKHRVPFPNMEYVLARLTAVSEEDRPMVCESVLQNWYEAVEVNAVIHKSRAVSVPSVAWTDISRVARIAENKPNDETTRAALERQLISELHHGGELTAQLARARQEVESVRKSEKDIENRFLATQRALEDTQSQLRGLQNSLIVRIAEAARRRWRMLTRL